VYHLEDMSLTEIVFKVSWDHLVNHKKNILTSR